MDKNDVSSNVRDYNGLGKWSAASIQERYRDYCVAMEVRPSRSLAPREHAEGEVRWIYPVVEEVIAGIEESDPACIALGVDFVEEDHKFPFGATLKSNTARALRRAPLNDSQKARLRERIATMLIRGLVPREMREYAKLLRRVGVREQ